MLSAHLRVLYLHGFASGIGSHKAQFFAAKLRNTAAHDLTVNFQIPDLCEGNFERLTITGQLQVIDRVLRAPRAEEPVAEQEAKEQIVLIGSSLGGYLAALYAASHPQITRLILLAPAFQFHRLWAEELGPERLDAWRQTGTLPVFHHSEGREMPLGYQLMEDAARYPAVPNFSQPALIFHGTRDTVVPVQYSAEFAEAHPNARLIEVNSGHELTDVLDEIWRECNCFLLYGLPN